MILICINNNNNNNNNYYYYYYYAIINNYVMLQDFILLFKISMFARKDFFEIWKRFLENVRQLCLKTPAAFMSVTAVLWYY